MQQIIDFLIGQYMFDMWVLQQWWMWAPLGIPGVAYALFMILKWSAFTLPLSVLLNNAIHGVARSAYRAARSEAKDA